MLTLEAVGLRGGSVIAVRQGLFSSFGHDFLCGGLSHRTEHRLCAAQGLPYHEVAATRSYVEVLAHLRQVTERAGRSASRSAWPRP
ncbi:hypothetical protein [Streptomyces huasconensis]|uniref:hypothetical protein n=1 Tax=Streptomyces huasconensis TaxID=1854574 RepID=UPI0036FBEE31